MKMDKVAGSGQDEFYTPRYAVEPIVQYLKKKKFKTIWCPFDTKDSQFVKVLKREKFKVIYTHISKGKDFFKIVDKGKVPKCDAIVSNPPYSKKTEVLTYLFELGIPFAMLLGIAGLFDSLERARLFSKHKFEVLFLNPRVDYFSGEDGEYLKQPPFQSVYICHDILPKKLLFAKVNKSDSIRGNPYSSTQTLFHCSPTVIDKIDPYYGSADFYGTLFFAMGPYSPGNCSYVYKINVNDNDLIHIRDLEATDDELQEVIEEVDSRCGDRINKEQALELLTEIDSGSLLVDYLGGYEYFHNKPNGYECVGDFEWWLQGQQARVARRMGYFGAESIDENGYVVMADMVGREHLLNNYMSVEDEDYDEWLYRQNPYLESENGKIVNPETNDIIWYHGSWFGKLDRLKAYNPRQYYDATYFSSSEKLANEFATGEMAWLGFYEEVPRLKRSGYLHFVKIDDVKLLDSDKVFSDKEELLLTDEGTILVQTLSDLGVEDSEIEKWLKKFRRGRFHAFSKDDAIFPYLISAMENLGYRGWFEREFTTKNEFHNYTNIALLYPDEDAKLVGGHIVKRTRKF